MLLRPYIAADIPKHAEAVRQSLDALMAELPFAVPGWTEEDSARHVAWARAAWDEGADRSFAVTDGRTGAFLGEASLSEPDRKASRVNLAWWTRSGVTGLGIATSAGRLVARHALGDLGFNRVEVLVAVENRGSQRVAEKIGARREGVLRERILLRGIARDAVIYSLLLRDVAPPIRM